MEILGRLWGLGATVAYHDPLVQTLPLGDGGAMLSVSDPEPEDFDLAIVVTAHPDSDYSWLERFEVLDCTYRTVATTRKGLI